MKIRIIVLLMLGLGVTFDVNADDFFRIEIGNLHRNDSFNGYLTDGINTTFVDDTNSDSGNLLGVGFGRLGSRTYLTGNIYLISTARTDDYYFFELSPHYRLSEQIYAGLVIGYQIFTSTDAEAAQSIGASKSKVDMSGLTAGFSMGALFLNGMLDLNFIARLVNGQSDAITGSFSGIVYDIDTKFESSYQVTVAYNFEISDYYR